MDGVDLAQFPQWTDGRRVIWTLGNSAARREQLLLKYMAAGTVTLLTSSHSPRKSPSHCLFCKCEAGSILLIKDTCK